MKRFRDKRKVVSLTLVGIAYLLIVTPLIISNLQKQQTNKGHASTMTAQQACGIATSNTMLIIDRSGSMNEQDASSGTKISNAKIAANNFVDLTAKNNNNEVGLVSFSNNATLDSPLTSDFTSVKSHVNQLKASGTTCIQCAIDQANNALTIGKRTAVKNVIVLLTDGLANYIEGSNRQVSQAVAEKAALTAAANAHKANDAIIFTIGLGKDVNKTFLQQLATSTGGQYYFPPSSNNLKSIYSQISQIIAQGSISGYVFNDANNNGQYDPGEQKLSGWTLQVTRQGSSATQTITTDNTGSFMIPKLCNGTYTLKEIPKTGWKQTVPANPAGYTIAITTGNAVTDKIFGNMIVPPTPTPVSTEMYMTVYLDDIGNRGDNANPSANSLSNKNPKHSSIIAETQIFTAQNQLIASGPGTLTYNPSLGAYTGNVPISAGFPSGNYLIDIKTPSHLSKQVGGIQTIIAGQTNTIAPVALVAGDINNDNVLNILDYNLLLNCYSDPAPPVACTPAGKTSADLNDDGLVNQFDYNLFLRELSVQQGQ